MSHLFSLPAELTIYTIGGLHAQWLEHLTPPDGEPEDAPCEVQASEVAEVDAAGVQLLLSLHNTLVRRRRSLYLSQPTPALTRACTALGATVLLASCELTEAAL